MADRTINIWLKVKGNAEKALSGISKQLKHNDDQLKKNAISWKGLAVAAGGMVILKKVSGWMSESIKLAQVQQDAEKRLSAAYGKSIAGLTQYATALQKKTRFGDEEIIQAQARIADFVKEESQVKALTKATLDFAEAKGMDLTSAADLLTKSVASSTNALARYGIEVDGAAGSAERAENLVNALNKAFGGTAEAMADTDAGRIKQMENAIGDLREEVGEALLPAMLDVKTATHDFYKFILDNEGTVGRAITSIANTISETIQGWNHLLGGGKRAQKQAKDFEVVGKEIKFYKSQVMQASEELAALEERGISSGSTYEAWLKVFEENNDALAKSLTYYDELRIKQNESTKKTYEATNGTLVNTEAMEQNAEAIKTSSYALDRYNQQMAAHFDLIVLGYQKQLEAIEAQESEDIASQERKKDTTIMLAQQTAQAVDTIMNAVHNRRMNELEERTSKELESVRNSTMSEKQKAKEIEKIEKAAAKERIKIRKAEWVSSLLMSIVNTALGVTNQLSSGDPYSAPARAAAVGVIGAIQTGIIAANKPKFYNGGIATNRDGMLGDTIDAKLRRGEEVLTPTDPRHSKNGGGAMTNQSISIGAPQITIQGNATAEVMPMIENALSNYARSIEDMFTNGQINADKIKAALA